MIDKRLLKDVISVSLLNGKNEFGDESFKEVIEVKPVRFDRSVTVKGTNNSKERSKIGVIYIYSKFTNVTISDEWLGAKVNDGTRNYKVTGYQPNFFNGKIFSYELEVI